MAKLTRATQKIFGDSALGTQITAFGTAMTNSPVYTKDPALLQTAASASGWNAAIMSDKAPFEEDTNGLCYLVTRQLAYLYQQGIPEWDAGTTYYTNSLCTVMQDGVWTIKRATSSDNNTGYDPTTDDGSHWVDYYSNRVIHTIGDPIITLNPVLEDNEIWLEGATVSRTTYANLYQIYGTTYGIGDGSTTFNLPDFRNRAIWGANSFGYIEAGLPNITGSFSGTAQSADNTTSGATGAFYRIDRRVRVSNEGEMDNYYGFSASRSSTIYGNSTTVQPPAIKVRVKTRYQ